MIENWKAEKTHEFTRDEILCLSFWEQPKININPMEYTEYNGYGDAAGDDVLGDERQRNSEGWIIVGGNFRDIMIYSIRNATLEKQLTGHTDSVTCMTLDGNMLFTGSDDSTIRSWNLTHTYESGIVGRHEDEPIQDLTCLDNGLLISCAYDGKVICWRYRSDVEHDRFEKVNQQLRCLGPVTESGMMLIGTNTFTILTQSITDWVNYRDDDISNVYDDYDEEQKEDGSDYDPLEGRNLDDAFEEAVENMTLEQLNKMNKAIMARDA